MNNDIEQINEAYSQTLRGAAVSDKQAKRLAAKMAALKLEFEFVQKAMTLEDYNEVYDPQARLHHQRRMKELPREMAATRKKYYGDE